MSVKTFKNTSEVSIEELRTLQQSGVSQITISDPETTPNSETYSIGNFIQIKREMNKYTSGIPDIPETDPNREKKIFTYLYMKMAQNIKYDERASEACGLTGYYRDAADWLITSASNLEGGLLRGSAICAGYSEILRNLMAEAGIKAKVISGGAKTRTDRTSYGSHAWNQVCLDGVYYSCDLTNDADFLLECAKPPYFLKSNEQLGEGEKNRFFRYPPKYPNMVEDATESISDELQEQLINEQRQILESQKEKETNTPQNKTSFMSKLKDFLGINKNKDKGDDGR